MSNIQHLYQIVFSPRDRQPLLVGNRREVYNQLYRQLIRQGCYVHRIGGIADHVHIIVEIPAKLSVSDVIGIAKQESSKSIRAMHLLPQWLGWQEGYGSFTYNKARDLAILINYVKNQEEHHRHITFVEEYRSWLLENGCRPDDPYFPDWLK